MSSVDYMKLLGISMYEGFLGLLDGESDEKTRDLFCTQLRKVAFNKRLPKDRMRRLATLLSEAAGLVAEELK